jgi:outer membrane protein OmpA-like peptidoglycan-associated protein
MSKFFKIIFAVIGLLILWVLTLYFRRAPIEQDLTNQVKGALNQPDFSQVMVSFEGRDGTLTGEVSSQALANEAESLAKGLWGVRVINNQLKVSAEATSMFATIHGYFQNGKFILGGIIPDEAIRTKLVQQAEKAFGAGNVVDHSSINPSVQLPNFFEKAVTAFFRLKGIDDAGFSIDDIKFVLEGKVPADSIKSRIGIELANTLAPLPVKNDLEVFEAAVSNTSFADLRTFFSNNTIQFEFRSSRLTDQARKKLNRAYELIKQVPEAKFELAGHTDNIGSRDFNMRLGKARAISVRLYLLEREIAPERLTVKSYGETQPKASNDTEEGRQQNRRVEFRLK